jgi:hypothetical protein
MGYNEHGGYPAEYANKIGHIRLIQDPYIQRVVEAFEDTKPELQGDPPPGLGHIDLTGASLAQIITVDGGSPLRCRMCCVRSGRSASFRWLHSS